jgi:hypothetical protein
VDDLYTRKDVEGRLSWPDLRYGLAVCLEGLKMTWTRTRSLPKALQDCYLPKRDVKIIFPKSLETGEDSENPQDSREDVLLNAGHSLLSNSNRYWLLDTQASCRQAYCHIVCCSIYLIQNYNFACDSVWV